VARTRLVSKKEKLNAFLDLLQEDGWEVYQEKLDNIFASASKKMANSTLDNVDYNRGYLHCIKLVKELRERIPEENREK
jgi:hypothetical protein